MSLRALSWSWQQELDPIDKLMLLALADHANDEDWTCWPSLSHLERKTGLSRTTTWRVINRLVKHGAVQRAGIHPVGSTIYRLAVTDMKKVGAERTYLGAQRNGVGAERNTGQVHSETDVGAQCTPNRKEPSVKPSGTMPIPCGMGVVGDVADTPDSLQGGKVLPHIDPLFQRFWTAYPRKKSKGKALDAWKKLKPSEHLVTLMLAAIERAKTSKDWRKDDGQFIPYPASWLNAYGWEDEDHGQPKPQRDRYVHANA
jgi:biotin operon repressor